jgi:hypothetical protein
LHVNTITAYRVINAVAFFLCCFLIAEIVRMLGANSREVIAGICFFATLKFGMKFTVYDPVLTDGLGTALLLTIIYATLARKSVLYLTAMFLGVLCRENLLPLSVFYVLFGLSRSESRKDLAIRVALSALPIFLFLFYRSHPLVLPDPKSGISAGGQIRKALFSISLLPETQGRFLVAIVNALGVMAVVVLSNFKAFLSFLKSNVHWGYYVLISFLLGILGGDERLIMLQFPLFIYLTLVFVRDGTPSKSTNCLPLLVILQLIAGETFLPWRGSEKFYLTRYSPYSFGVDFFMVESFCVALLVSVHVCLRGARREKNTDSDVTEGLALN